MQKLKDPRYIDPTNLLHAEAFYWVKNHTDEKTEEGFNLLLDLADKWLEDTKNENEEPFIAVVSELISAHLLSTDTEETAHG